MGCMELLDVKFMNFNSVSASIVKWMYYDMSWIRIEESTKMYSEIATHFLAVSFKLRSVKLVEFNRYVININKTKQT